MCQAFLPKRSLKVEAYSHRARDTKFVRYGSSALLEGRASGTRPASCLVLSALRRNVPVAMFALDATVIVNRQHTLNNFLDKRMAGTVILQSWLWSDPVGLQRTVAVRGYEEP